MRKLGRFALIGIAALVLLGLGASGSSPAAEASETTVTVYWNLPMPVQGFDETPQFVTSVTPLPCSNCYITEVSPELEVDAGGGNWIVANYTSAPPARLHHMVLFNHAYVDPTCAGSGTIIEILGDRWFASGDERGTLTFPAGYGYYMPAASPTNYWAAQFMVHNLSSQAHNFRLRMDFKYFPGSDNLKPVRHLWLDQNNCDVSSYLVNAGYEDDHWVWTSGQAAGTADDIEGNIFEIGGHVHDFGTSVAATLMKFGSGNETLICASRGGYATGSQFAPAHITSPGSPAAAHPADPMVVNPSDPGYLGHIEAMSACVTNTLIAAGDMIHLHTQYNATSTIPDVMGIMGAWVYDNCPNVTNPTQADILDDGYPGDGVGDGYGDACDKDADGDGLCNTGVQGPGGFSCTGTDPEDDGDGFDDTAEAWVQTNALDACGEHITIPTTPPMTYSQSWPGDISSATGQTPDTRNFITISDLSSFVVPLRRLDTSPGDEPAYHRRWDLAPGPDVFADDINIQDITKLILLYPLMFGGQRALDGPACAP